MPNDYAIAREARKTPSLVDPQNAPGGAVIQAPVPQREQENKLSGTEGMVGKFHDNMRFPQMKGRHFQEEEKKLTKI